MAALGSESIASLAGLASVGAESAGKALARGSPNEGVVWCQRVAATTTRG
jgi:hypothetical protein